MFRMDNSMESLMDRYDRLINDVKKVDLAQNVIYALIIQFVDMMEKM